MNRRLSRLGSFTAMWFWAAAAAAQDGGEPLMRRLKMLMPATPIEVIRQVYKVIVATPTTETPLIAPPRGDEAGGLAARSAVAAADPTFAIRKSYAFPQPARGTSTVTIRVQPGLADSVEVRVYDLTGRKVHSSSNFRNLGAFDDLNGDGPQFTFEHVWDISGVGSGVYTYVVTAKQAGQGTVQKKGKIAIVK